MDRGVLSKINEEIHASLSEEDASQLVRVRVSDAFWSTWRAYCDALGIPMGRGIAALIAHELRSVVEEDLERLGLLLREREEQLSVREEELSEREAQLLARERLLFTGEGAAHRREARLREWEERLQREERKPSGKVPLHAAALWPSMHARPSGQLPKVGRNDPCPCGSGERYKRCHGR